MAEFKTLPVDKVLVPERLRVVEDDHALAIQVSIIEHGLINPITVRATPAAKRPYTLVAGAHRLRAYELADEDWSRDIDAIIVTADKEEAALVEISENLFRNELSALDRAMFVMSYREIWERRRGKIGAGRPGNSAKLALLSDPTLVLEEEASAGFSVHVAERLGLSKRAVFRAQSIAQKLSPDLRRSLRGTANADNQSLLLKLARMEPERQKLVAVAFGETPDIARAIDLTDPHAKAKAVQTAQQLVYSRLVDSWERADDKTKAEFLLHIGASVRAPRTKLPSLTELLAETEGGAS